MPPYLISKHPSFNYQLQRDQALHCDIVLPPYWVNAKKLDDVMLLSKSPHSPEVVTVSFCFPEGCKIMVDAGMRLLSLANQLCLSDKKVCFLFQQGIDSTMGYLNRLGFFDHLDGSVDVLPERPKVSLASIHRGTNNDLMEIVCINRGKRDHSVPSRLADIIMHSSSSGDGGKKIGLMGFTIFGELIDNILDKSFEDKEMLYALLDKNGNVIITNRHNQQVMQPISRVNGTMRNSTENIFQWIRPSR